jgi:phospholipid transport system substrate-binding protein
MIKRFSSLIGTLVLGIVLCLSSAARAERTEEAQTFVAGNGDRMIAILDEPAGEERKQNFYVWLREVFDMDTLAGLALGPYRSTATPEQMAAYNDAFANYIVTTYHARFDAFTGYTFQVGQAKELGNGDVAVRTTISDPAGKPIVVDFRVRPDGDSFKVIDVVVEGLSMLKTQRDEFSSVIQRNGLDGLINSLQQGSN